MEKTDFTKKLDKTQQRLTPCDVACGYIICFESVRYVEYGGKLIVMYNEFLL